MTGRIVHTSGNEWAQEHAASGRHATQQRICSDNNSYVGSQQRRQVGG